jgi:hypothetical protein
MTTPGPGSNLVAISLCLVNSCGSTCVRAKLALAGGRKHKRSCRRSRAQPPAARRVRFLVQRSGRSSYPHSFIGPHLERLEFSPLDRGDLQRVRRGQAPYIQQLRLPQRSNRTFLQARAKTWDQGHGSNHRGGENRALEEIVEIIRDFVRKKGSREGFEPSVAFPLHTLSKRAPSTTRTSLRTSGTNSLPEGGEPCKSKPHTSHYMRNRRLIFTTTARFFRSGNPDVNVSRSSV